MRRLRSALLHAIRLVGGFALAQHLTRRQLRILCYHGFSIGEEYRVAPYVFMRAETFERRMRILHERGLPVVSLDEALVKLRRREIVNADTVITFDDGWASTLTIGAPILRKYRFPACVYLTTEHLSAGTEGFNMALAQMVHEARGPTVTLQDVHPLLDGVHDVATDPAATARKLVAAAAQIGSLPERQRLLAPIAAALGLDYAEFMRDGRFRLLDAAQVRALHDQGMSIQLHTHSHTLPSDSFEAMAREIEQNREVLRKLLGVVPRHFCYPSGKYSPRHPEWLERLGISSATTCDAGLNGPKTPVLLLKRYLDNELMSDMEFEAEIVGLRELRRRMRAALASLCCLFMPA